VGGQARDFGDGQLVQVLVIGANGFLGRHLMMEHMKRNDQVTAVYHSGTDHIPPGIPRVAAAELKSLPDSFDAVYIAGASIPYGHMDEPSPDLVAANVLLPLQTCSRFPHARVVFASSVAVYGTSPGVLDEESPFERITYYGQSKLAGEFVVRNHPSFAIVRFSSLYGRGMTAKTFIPRLIEMAQGQGELLIYGAGTRRQDYLHVTDAARYMIAAFQAGVNGAYLGVQGESVSNMEVARVVSELIPGTSIRTMGEDPAPSFVYDNSQSIRALQVRPTVTLRQGLQEMLG
jgi:nucleoside-diphosphate-sugar epimerase